MSNCLDSLIGEDNGCTTTTGRLYLKDIGVTSTDLEAFTGQGHADGSDLVAEVRRLSAAYVAGDVLRYFAPRIKPRTFIDRARIGFPYERWTQQTAVSNTLNGIEIDVCAKNSNVKLNISSIGFYGTETKTVTVTVWDLTDGTSLATQEISAVAGSFVTVQTDIVVSIPRKTTRILITTPETSFYRVNTINGGCASCGGEFRRSMVTARGATIDTSVPKMHSNVQGASTTGGLSVIASLVCDHAQILCENKESIALPLLYKYGEEIIKRGLWNVQRMNTETLAREVLEQRLAEYAGQYRKTMDEVLMGMPLPTDTECFTCNSRTRVVQVIP